MDLLTQIRDHAAHHGPASDPLVIALTQLLFHTRDAIIDDPQHALNKLLDVLGDGSCPFPDPDDEEEPEEPEEKPASNWDQYTKRPSHVTDEALGNFWDRLANPEEGDEST